MKTQDALKLLSEAAERFSPTAALDSQVLLAHLLGKSRAWVLAHPEAALDTEQITKIEQASQRLSAGEPLPYILGSWEFFGLTFYVTPDVLIPRPETELLVEQAMGWLHAHPGCRRIADVGTGSGCIAVSLATQIPDLQVTATDISREALQVARTNISRHGLAERIQLLQSDLLAGVCPPIAKRLNLICANLPYIPKTTLDTLHVSRWEPERALLGGGDGLDLIRRLLAEAPGKLSPAGLILLEIEAGQGNSALDLARAAFPASEASVLPDLADRDRLLVIQT